MNCREGKSRLTRRTYQAHSRVVGSVGHKLSSWSMLICGCYCLSGAQRSNGTRGGGNTSVHPGLGCSHEGVIKSQRGKGGTSLWSSG